MTYTRFAAFEESARLLLEDVLPRLHDRGCVKFLCDEFWVRCNDHFQRKCRNRLIYDPQTTPRVFQDSLRWAPFLTAVSQEPDFKPLLGRFVGPALSWFRFDPFQLAMGLSPTDAEFDQPRESLRFDEQTFSDNVLRLQSFIDTDIFEHETCVPIEGLAMNNAIVFEEGVSIEPISDRNLTWLLQMGAIAGDPPSGRWFRNHTRIQWGLHRRVQIRKEIRATLPLPTEGSPFAPYADDVDRLTSAFAIAANGRIRAGSELKRYAFGWPLETELISTGIWSLYPINNSREQKQDVVMTSEVSSQLQELWPKLADTTRTSPVQTALRRLRFAKTRPSIEDRLLDLGIAMESLFLPKDDDQTELNTRIATNAAFLLEEQTDRRLEVFKSCRDAYNARSKIAHGSEFLAWACDARINLQELEASAERIVRRGLKHAIIHGLPANWVDLVLN